MTLSSRVSVCPCVCVIFSYYLSYLFTDFLPFLCLSASQRSHSRGWEKIFGPAHQRIHPHGETLQIAFIYFCWHKNSGLNQLSSVYIHTYQAPGLFVLAEVARDFFRLRINAILVLWVFLAAASCVCVCVGPTTIKQQSHLQRLYINVIQSTSLMCCECLDNSGALLTQSLKKYQAIYTLMIAGSGIFVFFFIFNDNVYQNCCCLLSFLSSSHVNLVS